MKVLLYLGLTLGVIPAQSAIIIEPKQASNCNQKIYDSLYRLAALEAVRSDNYRARSYTVQLLRDLCNGQLSSFEKGGSR